MPVIYDFADLKRRHDWARQFAGGGGNAGDAFAPNRCAVVMGMALGVAPRPEKGEHSLKGEPFVPAHLRQQAFMAKYYFKAQEVADRLREEFGPPDIQGKGEAVLPRIANRPGIVFLQDYWTTPLQSVKSLFGQPTERGDHIDLWDGFAMAIFPDPEGSQSRFMRAPAVWFWALLPIRGSDGSGDPAKLPPAPQPAWPAGDYPRPPANGLRYV